MPALHSLSRRVAILAAMAVTLLPAAVVAAASSNTGANSSAWRCGVEGRVYTDTPCAGGREIEQPLPRPAADIAAAHRLAEHDKQLAERLRRERERREAAAIAASAHPVNLGPVRMAAREPVNARATQGTPKPRLRKPARAPGADEQTWRATAPASPRTPG